jgi:hypothetical protein
MNIDALTVKYPPGQVGSRSGHQRRIPLPAGATNVMLEFSVFIPLNWKPVKGGKMFGFAFGPNADVKASGGKWQKHHGSCRLMWRVGKTDHDIRLCPYVYLPTTVSETAFSPGYLAVRSVAGPGSTAGHDIWRKTSSSLALHRGRTHKIKLEMRLNTSGKADGVLAAMVDTNRLEVRDMVWHSGKEEEAAVSITSAELDTWYGGGSKDWAPPRQQTLTFRNISIQTQTNVVSPPAPPAQSARALTPLEQEFAKRWVLVRRRLEEGATMEEIVNERPFLKKYVDPASPHFISSSSS